MFRRVVENMNDKISWDKYAMNSLLCSIILASVMIMSFFIKLDAWCSTCSGDDACDVAVGSGKNCWCEYNKLFRLDGKVLSFVFEKTLRSTEPPQAALLILNLFILQRSKAEEFLKMIISIQFAIRRNQMVINMFGFLGIFVKISLLNVSAW